MVVVVVFRHSVFPLPSIKIPSKCHVGTRSLKCFLFGAPKKKRWVPCKLLTNFRSWPDESWPRNQTKKSKQNMQVLKNLAILKSDLVVSFWFKNSSKSQFRDPTEAGDLWLLEWLFGRTKIDYSNRRPFWKNHAAPKNWLKICFLLKKQHLPYRFGAVEDDDSPKKCRLVG